MQSIALLITSFNRKEKTLHCLGSLFSQINNISYELDVFVLDDGSTDGTSVAVQSIFPKVKLYTGDGTLYWAGGMRRIWDIARQYKTYDLFLLVNDDVIFFPDSLKKFLDAYALIKDPGIILVGSMQDPVTKKISYGGVKLIRKNSPKFTTVTPDENKTLSCDLGNANLMLIDKETVDRIGIFSTVFRHSIADYDYSLKAVKAGIRLLIAPGYYGYCTDDHGKDWLPQTTSLKKRIQYLYSPKGLEYKEYIAYIKTHFPGHYIREKYKLWLKTFFPFLWNQLKVRKR